MDGKGSQKKAKSKPKPPANANQPVQQGAKKSYQQQQPQEKQQQQKHQQQQPKKKQQQMQQQQQQPENLPQYFMNQYPPVTQGSHTQPPHHLHHRSDSSVKVKVPLLHDPISNYNTGQNRNVRYMYKSVDPKGEFKNRRSDCNFHRSDSNTSSHYGITEEDSKPPMPFCNKKKYEQRTVKQGGNAPGHSRTFNAQPSVAQQMKGNLKPNETVYKKPVTQNQPNINDFQATGKPSIAARNKRGVNPFYNNYGRKHWNPHPKKFNNFAEFGNYGDYDHREVTYESTVKKNKGDGDWIILDQPQDGGWTILNQPITTDQENVHKKIKNRRRNNKKPICNKNDEPALMSFSRSKSNLNLNQEYISSEIVEVDCSDSESICESEVSYKTGDTAAISSDGDGSEVEKIVLADAHKNAKGVIGIFWDIENCAVPKGGSCREIVKKIRDTFYGNRKEETFIVACDVVALPQQHRKELNNAQVELFHVDSSGKNAADFKLRDNLRRFVDTTKPEGSCVVLISGDFDFAGELHNLRYRNQIFVVLIHNRMVKPELCDLANQHILFEDFVKGISLLEYRETQETFLHMENIPVENAGKTYVILKHLIQNLKGIMMNKINLGKCVARFNSKEEAKVALMEFNGRKSYIFGSQEVRLTLSSKQFVMANRKTVHHSDNQAEKETEPEVRVKKVDYEKESKQLETDMQLKQSSPTKASVVLLLECRHSAGLDFWKGFLKNIVKDDSVSEVFVHENIIHVYFECLKSAKKMRKLLEEGQQSELTVIKIQDSSTPMNIVAAGHTSKTGLFDQNQIRLETELEVKDFKRHTERITETPTQPPKTSVFLVLESSHCAGSEFWKAFLRNIIKDVSANDVLVRDNMIYLNFDSLNSAKKVKKLLEKDQQQELKVIKIQKSSNLENFVSEDKSGTEMENIIKKCKSTLENKYKKVLSQHLERIVDVETEVAGRKDVLRSLPYNTKPSDCEIALRSLQVTEGKLLELQAQEEVFLAFVTQKMHSLELFSTDTIEKCKKNIDTLKLEVGRECHLLAKALPIYAKKIEVFKTVEKFSVSVILAGTGTGKSTQITQLLYQMQLLETGRIVCTQPKNLSARYLSEYVSQEMGCTVGTLVGARVGANSKVSDATRILYMSEHSLLSECLTDPMLGNYSCVIVDEVNERNVFCDLLLGMLKSIIQQRQDLKIVLTSAIINPKLYQDFFGIPDEAVLIVSELAFPIDIVWNNKMVTVAHEYINQAVLKAFDIHMSEEAGHILVFVATPEETHEACKAFGNIIKQKKTGNAVCFPLHDKLSPAEIQKVFSHVPNNFRKIIFTTSFSETCITVPGICYVIDTGMVREIQFDPRTDSSTLKISFVTQRSAEQRKSHAGKTQSGSCYRLFSKENYQEMLPDLKSEMLRVNLGQAMLKLMDLGIENPCNFQFIESPAPSSFLSTMSKLSRLGAIQNDKVTELGRKMGKIPLEPSFSRLILQGFEEKIGYEAVIVATLASNFGMTCFQVEDNKQDSELKIPQICHEDGDFHTFLNVYKEWIKAPKVQKVQWCLANQINEKSMIISKEIIHELLNTCEKELGIPLSIAYSSQLNMNTILQYLLLEVFSTNLCIFSGHPQMGYISAKDFAQVHVHPSSSLFFLDIRPEFVIFQTNLVTTKNYILNIMPVSEECINKAIKNGICKVAVIEKLKESTFSPLQLGPYGFIVLKQFCGEKETNRIEAEQAIAKQTKDFVEIEVDFEMGIILVYCKKKHHSCVKNIVGNQIAKIISEIESEDQVVSINGSSHGIGYLMSAGAVIMEVIMPKEYLTFSLKNLDASFDISNLMAICDGSGHKYTLKESSKKRKMEISVTCKLVSEAAEVFNLVSQKTKCMIVPQVALRQRNSESMPIFQLHVMWIRRPCKGIGFVKFEDSQTFTKHSPHLILSSLEVHGKPFKVQISNKNPEELFLRQLHEFATVADIKQMFNSLIGTDVKYDVKILHEESFETTIDELKTVEVTLTNAFCQYARKKDIIVQVLKPQIQATFWKATIFFHNSGDGQTTYNEMKDRATFPGTSYKFQMFVLLNTKIVCHKDIFHLAKEQLDDAMESYKNASTLGDYLNIKASPCKTLNDFISIDIKSNNLRDLELVNKNFHDILRGEEIDCLGKPLREKLFLESGKDHLRKLEKEVGVKIYFDNSKKKISILGLAKAQMLAKSAITSYLELLYNQSGKIISLAGPTRPKGLLKCFLHYTLERLRTSCELDFVELNLTNHSIYIFGKKEAIERAENIVDQLISQLVDEEKDIREMSCPVCLSPVDEEDQYRLQCCGHVYCQACVQMQMKDCNIPLVCLAQNCNNPFVMDDFRYLLSPEMKRSVAAAALKQLVQRRGKEFKYCPTPECPVVYKVSTDVEDSLMTCSFCTNQICTRCNTYYHHGNSCKVFTITTP